MAERGRLAAFVVVVALVLAGAAWWSRTNNCETWRSKVEAFTGGREGLTLVGADALDDIGPIPYGCSL